MTAKPKVVFVSSNINKAKEVQTILGTLLEVEHVSLDLTEIQSEDVEQIAIHKAIQASNKLQCNVLVEDSCLGFDAFHGLPGPFVKYFLEKLKPEGLVQLLNGWENKNAKATCAFAYCSWSKDDPNSQLVECFTGQISGEIVEPRGSRDFGWSCIFQPQGYIQTYGEMPSELKNSFSHRALALKKVKEFFEQNI